MTSVSEEVEVGAPPATVFPYLIEPERLARWLGGFRGSRPLTDGPIGVGTRSIDTLVENGREIELTTEIVRYDPPAALDVKITGKGIAAVSRYRLAGVDRTTLTHTQDIRLSGFSRLLAPMVKGMIARRIREDFERLKAAIEADAR